MIKYEFNNYYINKCINKFLYLFLISKILGKKQIAEMSFIDYVVGISIGSVAAEWSTDVENPWYYYAIAMGIYMLITLLFDVLERKNLFLKKLLKGKEVPIIEDGKINFKNVKRTKIELNDILGMCRAKGFFDVSTISYALFETNGDLSILPKSAQRPTIIQDLRISEPESKPTNYIIMDGKINQTALKNLSLQEDTIYKKLKIQNKNELKNIFLAIYDEKTKHIKVYHKKENI